MGREEGAERVGGCLPRLCLEDRRVLSNDETPDGLISQWWSLRCKCVQPDSHQFQLPSAFFQSPDPKELKKTMQRQATGSPPRQHAGNGPPYLGVGKSHHFRLRSGEQGRLVRLSGNLKWSKSQTQQAAPKRPGD